MPTVASMSSRRTCYAQHHHLLTASRRVTPYPLPTSFEAALAEYTLGLIGSDELPHVATCAVLAGIEAPTLAALAGSTHGETPAELREMFARGMSEAGIEPPDERRAAILLIEQCARDVVDQRVTAIDAVLRMKAMFDVLTSGADHDHDALGLAPLQAAVRDCYYGEDENIGASAAAVRAACEHLVRERSSRA